MSGRIQIERERWPNLTDRDLEVARQAVRAVGDMFPEVQAQIDGDMANDRYTTEPTLRWCKDVLGVKEFDLDVAACVESHKAPRWYGQQMTMQGPHGDIKILTDGLVEIWDGPRIWCNPPYDNLEPWVIKAWETIFLVATRRERFVGGALSIDTVIGMLIPDNRREQPFWQNYIEPYRDGRRDRRLPVHIDRMGQSAEVAHDAGARLFTHSLPCRQPFGVPGNPEGKGQQSPPFGVALLEWRFQ